MKNLSKICLFVLLGLVSVNFSGLNGAASEQPDEVVAEEPTVSDNMEKAKQILRENDLKEFVTQLTPGSAELVVESRENMTFLSRSLISFSMNSKFVLNLIQELFSLNGKLSSEHGFSVQFVVVPVVGEKEEVEILWYVSREYPLAVREELVEFAKRLSSDEFGIKVSVNNLEADKKFFWSELFKVDSNHETAYLTPKGYSRAVSFEIKPMGDPKGPTGEGPGK